MTTTLASDSCDSVEGEKEGDTGDKYGYTACEAEFPVK